MPKLWRGDTAFVSHNLLPEFVSKNFLGGSRNCRGAAAKLNVTGGEWGGGGGDFLDVLACRPLNCPGQSGAKSSQFVCLTWRDYFGEYHQMLLLITNTFQSKSVFKETTQVGNYGTLRICDFDQVWTATRIIFGAKHFFHFHFSNPSE